MSSTPYFRIAIRSMPKPNAQPLYSSGSMPTALNTFGWTMPQPPSSIQRLLVLEPDVDLGRRLGEGEEAGPEPHPGVGAEVRADELEDGAFQVDHGHVAVDDQGLELVELKQVGLVDRVGPVDLAGDDDADAAASASPLRGSGRCWSASASRGGTWPGSADSR